MVKKDFISFREEEQYLDEFLDYTPPTPTPTPEMQKSQDASQKKNQEFKQNQIKPTGWKSTQKSSDVVPLGSFSDPDSILSKGTASIHGPEQEFEPPAPIDPTSLEDVWTQGKGYAPKGVDARHGGDPAPVSQLPINVRRALSAVAQSMKKRRQGAVAPGMKAIPKQTETGSQSAPVPMSYLANPGVTTQGGYKL